MSLQRNLYPCVLSLNKVNRARFSVRSPSVFPTRTGYTLAITPPMASLTSWRIWERV
jgi:hypothetical protein